eukprot:scaffold190386_cov22-Tisochrysis_lutea.AAC.1
MVACLAAADSSWRASSAACCSLSCAYEDQVCAWMRMQKHGCAYAHTHSLFLSAQLLTHKRTRTSKPCKCHPVLCFTSAAKIILPPVSCRRWPYSEWKAGHACEYIPAYAAYHFTQTTGTKETQAHGVHAGHYFE